MSYQLPVVKGPQVVYEFECRDVVIRAAVDTYRGRTRLDLRVWWEPSPGGGLKPTKKGINLPVEAIDDLESAVAALKAATEGTERSSSTWNDAA